MYYKTLGLGYLFWSTDASGSPIEPTTQAMESSVTCLWKVVDTKNDLSSMRRVWIHLDNLVHEVAKGSDTIQDGLKVGFLFPPTRTGRQIQADKTCMQWLTKIAGRLA